MTLVDADILLNVLRRTQLLAPEQVEQIERELVPHYPDCESLALYLVEIDWLTPYQMQLCLAGRWDEIVIGPYQVMDRLGEGGVSEVFKAWDTLRGRIVALKVLRQDVGSRSELIRQFAREQQAITRLNHPNVIKTFDAGHVGDLFYFAMECVEGMDLERFIRTVGPLPIDVACDFARQAAQGLQHSHGNGLVHRDIKPANLFLIHPPLPGSRKGPEPMVKILDWGLARCIPAEGETVFEHEGEKGRLIGTADYIAPEQIEDATLVDIRADIYSMGCVLYFLLTGYPPFRGNSVMQKIVQHREAPPPSVRELRPDVPVELDEFIQRLLAKEPEQRVQIPLLLVAALRKFTAGQGGSGQGSALRNIPAPGTVLNLPRPQTHSTLSRPTTHPTLQRPDDK
jgi:serine/threonine protein kinase